MLQVQTDQLATLSDLGGEVLQLVVAAVEDGQAGQLADAGRQARDLVLSDAQVGQVDEVAQLWVNLFDSVEPVDGQLFSSVTHTHAVF